MKKLSLLVLTLFTIQFSFAQTPSCCSPSATQEFAMLSKNESFIASHLAPLPFKFEGGKGKMITIKTAGAKANVYEVKAAKSTKNYLFVFHEWWGLNDYIRQEAERLQMELGNLNVIAIDLYDGQVAVNPDSAAKIMHGMKDERAREIINGVIKYAGKDARISTIGWCFGGGWSMQAVLMCKTQAVGCVVYYGQPELNPDKLKSLNCSVLGLFAKNDDWINPALVERFEKVMKNTNKRLTVKSYDAVHAFANPSNPKYDKVAAEDAHARVLEYLSGIYGKR
ncbi:MAG: dienelactone hydrolase family protein [Bacteroidia bacterium]